MMKLDILYESFGASILAASTFRGETTLTVRREVIADMAHWLRDEKACAFAFLSDLCGVDLFPATPRFAVVYHLYSPRFNRRLRIKVLLSEEDALVDSVVPVWETADWHERECFDLFGIRFVAHPDLRRILTAEDFAGHALRKDYPLAGRVSA